MVTYGGRDAVVWDAGDGDLLGSLGGHSRAVVSAKFSRPDGRHVATLDTRGTVRIFGARSFDEIGALPGAGGPYYVSFDSRSNAALLLGQRGVQLRRCDACQSAGGLLQRARVTRTAAEVARIERSPTVP